MLDILWGILSINVEQYWFIEHDMAKMSPYHNVSIRAYISYSYT